jgi:hypothetical protein
MQPHLKTILTIASLFIFQFAVAQNIQLTNNTKETVTKVDEQNRNAIPPPCLCVGPFITSQPVSSLPTCIGTNTVSFTVCATGTGPLQYQWRENAAIITDNATYNGTNTPTLTINNPSYSLNGKTYRCIVTNCSGRQVITNANVTLNLSALPTDINKDGITDSIDFNLLLQQYNLLCPACPEDLSLDGTVNNDDFLILAGDYYETCQ